MRKSKRPPTRRKPVAVITDRAIDLFDDMETLETQCSCGGDVLFECDACEKYWDQHNILYDELKLKPWQWPAYANFEGDKSDVIERYRMLKAASDERKRA